MASPRRRPRALVVVVLMASAGACAQAPKVHLSPPTATVPPPSSTTTTVPAPTTTRLTTPPGIVALAQLLPSDATAAACSANQSTPNLTGLTSALICNPTGLPGGQVFAFQFDSAADYSTSLAALNKFKGFDSTKAGATCPPGAEGQDQIGWHNNVFPTLSGQTLECLSVGTNNDQPDYIWTYPSENVIMDAQAAANSSFADLDSWWTKDAPPRG